MSDTQGRYRIGVDVGGTFTDAAVFDDAAGSLRYAKVPSTPADPARAVLDVLERLGVDLGEVQRFIHGITIGTNAVLEGRGAEVWMLTTAGFRDVLEIARTNRTVLYDITALKPPPLVPCGRTLEIDERMAWDGSVLRPLDLDQARAAVQSLPPGVAVAVCFLHSYANPGHERTVAALVREGTGGHGPRAGFVTASYEVLPEFREYERFNTTALNAYIGPLIDGYLARLQAAVAARGYRSPVFIMTSNGGVATAGPMHGAFIAEELEIERILVPTGPGNFAALGSLISDVKQDFVRTRTLLPRRLASFAEIADEFDRLEAQGRRSLEAEGVAPEHFSSRRALGMRYLGQSWEIDVDVPPDMGHRGGAGGRFPRHPRTAFRASQRRRDRGGELPADRDRPGQQARVRRVACAGRPRRRPGRDAVRVLWRPVLRHPGAGAGSAAGRGLPRGAGDRRGGGRHHRGAARVALPGARLGRPVDGER